MELKSIRVNWRYAIGEFLIVVIGILAAFQLDSWKENRDEAKLVNEYLSDIRAGLRSDSLFHQNALEYFNQIEDDMSITRDALLSGELTLSKERQNSIRNLTDWYRIYISNTAFEDLNNSGRLNLIKDKQLRYNLIAYYQYIDFVKILDEEYNSSLSSMNEHLLRKLVFYNNDELVIAREDVDLVLNYLYQKKSYIDSYLGHRDIIYQINKTLIDSID